MKKILIATGGTGGHIFPALATAEELRSRGCEVCFIGAFGQAAEALKRQGFRFVSIGVTGFVGKGAGGKISALFGLIGALFNCTRVILSFRPQVVVGFGGYSSFPTILMASVVGRRVMIHEQNAIPGLANRILARIVPRVCVGFEDSLRYFPKESAVWTGTPFRPLNHGIDRRAAARKFGLDPSKKTVLVFGGSQGARRINECFWEVFENFSPALDWQVIHATGSGDLASLQAKYSALKKAFFVRAFIENIDEAYAACDIVIARAGAGTVTELGVLGIPAILIPYRGAKNHQLMNAKVLERAGSAVIIEENSLSSDILGAKILEVIERCASRRDFKEALGDEFRIDATRRLVDEIERIVEA